MNCFSSFLLDTQIINVHIKIRISGYGFFVPLIQIDSRSKLQNIINPNIIHGLYQQYLTHRFMLHDHQIPFIHHSHKMHNSCLEHHDMGNIIHF